MTDYKVRRYTFFTQALKTFKLGCFQAIRVANKLTDFVSPAESVYPLPGWLPWTYQSIQEGEC